MASFAEINQWAENISPVFIMGSERSGTSIVFQMITSHPAFISFDIATVETFCFSETYERFFNTPDGAIEIRTYLGDQYDEFERFVEPIRTINEKCNEIGVPRELNVDNQIEVSCKRHYRELIRAFFYFSSINMDDNRMAEKTPGHLPRYKLIMDAFPKAKIIVCFRSVPELIASHRKRYQKEIELGKSTEDESIQWLNKTTAQYVTYFQHLDWMYYNLWLDYPDAVKRVTYSDLTSGSDYIQELFDFIEEDPSEIKFHGEGMNCESSDWDPLLQSMPVENKIDISKWLFENESEEIDRLLGDNKLSGWD